jgi:hypothetical protein
MRRAHRLRRGTTLIYRFLDPSIQLDVYADKPWALSPTLATFNYLSLSKDKPAYEHTVQEGSLGRLREMCDTDDDVGTS